ncbi:MAG: hypothetical protein AB8I58_15515 [Anaerolineales bacterium]|jgi:hypothetical protein
MVKSILKGALVIASGLGFGFLGLLIGAYIGGNFAETFIFNGVRGYEATGQLGFWAGIIVGLALSIFLLFRRPKRR